MGGGGSGTIAKQVAAAAARRQRRQRQEVIGAERSGPARINARASSWPGSQSSQAGRAIPAAAAGSSALRPREQARLCCNNGD